VTSLLMATRYVAQPVLWWRNMAAETENMGLDASVDSITNLLEAEAAGSDTSATNAVVTTTGEAEPQTTGAIGEDEDKSGTALTSEPQTPGAIAPPASWPNDDKETFTQLPTPLQQRVVAREQEREVAFSQRSRVLAERERQLADLQQAANQAQSHYLAELGRLNAVASQLMPARFADIKSEADYLALKVKDPARASEYEAFAQVLRNAAVAQQQALQMQRAQYLDNEWNQLQDKFPEFKDPAKAKAIMDGVRKAAVDFYGYRPEEVEIVADHRHVQIIREAVAWRVYQANLKAAAAKKTAPQPTATLRSGAATGASPSNDQRKGVLNRVRTVSSDRQKADLIASLI